MTFFEDLLYLVGSLRNRFHRYHQYPYIRTPLPHAFQSKLAPCLGQVAEPSEVCSASHLLMGAVPFPAETGCCLFQFRIQQPEMKGLSSPLHSTNRHE